MRRTLSALTVAAAVTAATLIGSPAQAANPPVIVYASGTPTPGVIAVSYAADAGVAAIVAHVVDPSVVPETEVATVTAFHFGGGTPTYGYWVSDNPVTLPHLGNYRLDIELTDNDGVHVAQQAAGWLYSFVQMSFADVTVGGKATYADRDVTVSGRLVGTWPDGTVRPIEGQPVEVMTYLGGPFDTTSDRNGKFKVSVTIQAVDDFIYLYTLDSPDHPFYAQAYYDTSNVPVTQAPSRITMDADRTTVLAGETLTVTGQATWKSPRGWRPSPNQYVVFQLCYPDGTYCSFLGSATTDSQGRFTVTVTPWQSGLIKAVTYYYDPFISSDGAATIAVTVLQLARFTDFSAVRQSADQVQVTGHLDFPGSFTPWPIPVEIQFSLSGTGAWHTQQTIDIANNPTNPEGIFFQQSVQSDQAGYWRVYYAGVPTGFEAATSQVVQVGTEVPATAG